MTTIIDNGFARVTKETLVRDPNTSGALTGNDIAYNGSLTLNEKISTIPGGEVDLTASVVLNVPSGTITSDNVQDAINELDTKIYTNFIPYTGATKNVDLGVNNLTVDTNTLFVDKTNHRVGIGTITPSSQLQIDNSNISEPYIKSTGTGIASRANIKFGTPTRDIEFGIRAATASQNPDTIYIYAGAYRFLMNPTNGNTTFSGNITTPQVIQTSNVINAVANAATVPITSYLSTVKNNSAATLTITITTTGAVDGQELVVRVLDFSAVAQTITWVNTENSTVSVPGTSNGSTTLPRTVKFMYNTNTSKWRCIQNV